MANPIKTFLNALIGKDSSKISDEEIKKAEQAGTMAARNAAKRIGIVEQVEVDAEAARQAAKAKAEEQDIEGKNEERTN